MPNLRLQSQFFRGVTARAVLCRSASGGMLSVATRILMRRRRSLRADPKAAQMTRRTTIGAAATPDQTAGGVLPCRIRAVETLEHFLMRGQGM